MIWPQLLSSTKYRTTLSLGNKTCLSLSFKITARGHLEGRASECRCCHVNAGVGMQTELPAQGQPWSNLCILLVQGHVMSMSAPLIWYLLCGVPPGHCPMCMSPLQFVHGKDTRIPLFLSNCQSSWDWYLCLVCTTPHPILCPKKGIPTDICFIWVFLCSVAIWVSLPGSFCIPDESL